MVHCGFLVNLAKIGRMEIIGATDLSLFCLSFFSPSRFRILVSFPKRLERLAGVNESIRPDYT